MARIVVIAPGRGTYNRKELNYIDRFAEHPRFEQRQALLAEADALRTAAGRTPISQLDRAGAFAPSTHIAGHNASGLIFTCSAADLALLNPDHDVTAVLGNSMGWYTTLYTGGALSFAEAFRVVDTMGAYQQDRTVGGQIIYPVVDDAWRIDPEHEAIVTQTLDQIRARGEDHWVGLSIRLGGFRVLAGTDAGVKALLNELPKRTLGALDYPFQLARHAAFHTPLMNDMSAHGLDALADIPWRGPARSMIDGRGALWRPHQTHAAELRSYTLGHQVVEPYDFSASVRVALREHNPDHLVLLGPGETLGGAVAHVMIHEGWRGIRDKRDFQAAQKEEAPPLIAMNRPDQAAVVI